MAEKLRQADKKLAVLKLQHQKEINIYKTKLEDANKHMSKLRSTNRNLNKKLLHAIEAIKMSCFSYELNQDHTESLINQLVHENKNLRACLKIQNKYECRKEVEEILKSEELIVRNKESFLRSRSMQMRNNAMFVFTKKDEDVYTRKGKRSSGKLSPIYLFRRKRTD